MVSTSRYNTGGHSNANTLQDKMRTTLASCSCNQCLKLLPATSLPWIFTPLCQGDDATCSATTFGAAAGLAWAECPKPCRGSQCCRTPQGTTSSINSTLTAGLQDELHLSLNVQNHCRNNNQGQSPEPELEDLSTMLGLLDSTRALDLHYHYKASIANTWYTMCLRPALIKHLQISAKTKNTQVELDQLASILQLNCNISCRGRVGEASMQLSDSEPHVPDDRHL
jgi:hypothetical protein